MATQAKRDYYEVLAVTRTATDQEIKSAYRKLAMQYHPDRNPGNADAEEKFKECTEAYSVLIDAEKRQRYDQFGHAGVNGGGGFSGFDPSNFQDFGDIFGDIFSDFFGVNIGGGRRGRAQRGGDARADLTLTFEEAAFGKKTAVKVRRYDTCEECHGSGAAAGKGPSTCPSCGGRGQVRYQQGFFSIARTCPTCQGAGRVISDPCKKCKGESRVMREHTVEVSVPAGVEDGTRIRYQEQGDAGPNGAPAGDLYVVLHVKPHAFFERDGKDLYCSVPISFPQAALGAEIVIPTLEGEHKLKVPEGTQTGTTFRIKGKGVPAVQSSGKGDLFVKVRVTTPSKLTKRQRELLEELGGMFNVENKPEPRSLFEKVKEIFG
ncbi:MAG TPA: molecular chaperone DnaJ [Candidatus Limnocylindrales bacterium]|nr:molecular chaperone DnaJ [Candidatus Limnocylindrales bacterium]